MTGLKRSLFINLFWVVFSLAVVLESWRLDVGTLHAPGPGFLPFIAAGLLGGLAVIALIQSWVLKKETENDREGFGGNLLRVILLTSILIVYIYLLNVLGFLIDTFLLLLCLFRVIEPLAWKTVFLASIITLVVVYLLFETFLGTPLPKGLLGL
jgi:putative tricarboxylic transport membrane protein